MSTKIYNGYRSTESADIIDLCSAIRETLLPVRERLILQMLAGDAAKAIDAADLAGEPRPEYPLGKAARDFSTGQESMKETDWGHDPYRFEASFGRDPKTGRIHILTYVESEELRKAFESISGIEEYPYWNNAEGPDDVSDAEWEDRGEVWDRVLPGAGVPGESMSLTFTLLPKVTTAITLMMWEGKEEAVRRALPFAPSLVKRARIMARELGDEALSRSEECKPSDAGIHKVMDLIFASNKTPNDAIQEAVAKTMLTLTAEDLSGDNKGKPVTTKSRKAIDAKVSAWVKAVYERRDQEASG